MVRSPSSLDRLVSDGERRSSSWVIEMDGIVAGEQLPSTMIEVRTITISMIFFMIISLVKPDAWQYLISLSSSI